MTFGIEQSQFNDQELDPTSAGNNPKKVKQPRRNKGIDEANIAAINDLLLTTRKPFEYQRKSRPVDYSRYKASEWNYFCFYMGLFFQTTFTK